MPYVSQAAAEAAAFLHLRLSALRGWTEPPLASDQALCPEAVVAEGAQDQVDHLVQDVRLARSSSSQG